MLTQTPEETPVFATWNHFTIESIITSEFIEEEIIYVMWEKDFHTEILNGHTYQSFSIHHNGTVTVQDRLSSNDYN